MLDDWQLALLVEVLPTAQLAIFVGFVVPYVSQLCGAINDGHLGVGIRARCAPVAFNAGFWRWLGGEAFGLVGAFGGALTNGHRALPRRAALRAAVAAATFPLWFGLLYVSPLLSVITGENSHQFTLISMHPLLSIFVISGGIIATHATLLLMSKRRSNKQVVQPTVPCTVH